MAEPGIKVPADALGYEPSPELTYLSSQLQERYNKQYLPEAEKIPAALSPQADEQARLQAADAMKKITGTDQPQLINAIQSALMGDIRGIAISMNGGADVPSQAYAPDGSTWTKIFNERKTKQNPFGEVRGYVDANGKRYTREEAEKLVGGPIVSQVEIPLSQQNFYKAQGIRFDEAARAQATEWNARQKSAAVALANGGFIAQTANDLDKLIYNNPEIIKSSVNPEIRALVAGMGQLRTGDTRGLVEASQKLKEFSQGNGTREGWEQFKKNNAGLTAGLNFTEGKGTTDSKGKTVSSNDIDRQINDFKTNMSSENAIQARQQDLLQRAQFVAAKHDPAIINLIQQGINLEFQKALAIKKIEDAGGIGISQPTLPNEVGDDFVLSGVKNNINKNYGELADIYGNQVEQLRSVYQNRTPAIGEVESLIRNNPLVRETNQRNKESVLNYSKRMSQYLRELNPQTPAQVIAQPSSEATSAAKAPPKVEVVPGQPAGSRAPTNRPAARPASALESIFGK